MTIAELSTASSLSVSQVVSTLVVGTGILKCLVLDAVRESPGLFVQEPSFDRLRPRVLDTRYYSDPHIELLAAPNPTNTNIFKPFLRRHGNSSRRGILFSSI
ncbi:hypothetical protein MPLA_140222 [Mesorhizobium sp. ORS 3359]|nr:hypothetical protein MPLA_140222 [Mesorhizobium sp. ORS 3359]